MRSGCATDALLRIDPATDTIAGSVPVELAPVFYRLAFGAGRVWALGSESFVGDTVIGLDPASGSITSFPAGGSVADLTYAFDALWLTIPASGSVLRLDSATGEARELLTGLPSPTQITAGLDSLWVTLHGAEEDEARSGDPQVARIDPATNAVTVSYESEPEIHAIQGPLTEAFGSIWTVNIEEDTVYRLTP
jgi:streptogramin lyase